MHFVRYIGGEQLHKCADLGERRAKGRSSRKIQQEFEHIRKRHLGQRFWGGGYFSTTAGNITEDVVRAYLDRHIAKEASAPPHGPTSVSR